LENINDLTKYGKEVRLREYEEGFQEFSQTRAVHQLAENVRQKIYPSILRPAARTISRWYSAFVDPYRGMGFPMTNNELEIVNEFRRIKGRSPLLISPGLRYLNYGKNKDGYWNYEKFRQQVEDIMDVVEVIYNNYQLVIEVDQSSGRGLADQKLFVQ
jgi:hypothetical protein